MEFFEIEKKIILEPETKKIKKIINSDRKLYDEYCKLLPPGTPIPSFTREPNGGDGTWVFPFPKDIWDNWINAYIGSTNIEPGEYSELISYIPTFYYIEEDDEKYIPPPSNNTVTGGYAINRFKNGEYVFPDKFMRLWDFNYNPEHFVNPDLPDEKRRVRFPRYNADGSYTNAQYTILPRFLPNIIPDISRDEQPYSFWQKKIDFVDDEAMVTFLMQNTQLSQKLAIILAHGEKDSYRLRPVDITRKITQPRRPSTNDVLFNNGMPYGSYVLQNINPHDTNGWYYIYRQKVVRSKFFNFPEKEETFKALIEARKLLALGMVKTIRDAALFVLPSAANDVAYFNKVLPSSGGDFLALKRANEDINELVEYIEKSISTPMYVAMVDKYGEPVYNAQPSTVITVEVHDENENEVHKSDVTLIYPDTYITLEVPPILSETNIGMIDDVNNLAFIDWSTSDSSIKLEWVTPNVHSVRAFVPGPGEYMVKCYVRTNKLENSIIKPILEVYEFKIECFKISCFIYTDKYDTRFHVLKRNAFYEEPSWTIKRFANAQVENMQSETQLIRFFLKNKDDIMSSTNTSNNLFLCQTTERNESEITIDKYEIEELRCFIARYNPSKYDFEFVVFPGSYFKYNINHYGDMVTLFHPKINVPYPITVLWYGPKNNILFETQSHRLDVYAQLPSDLGLYIARTVDMSNHSKVLFETKYTVNYTDIEPRKYMGIEAYHIYDRADDGSIVKRKQPFLEGISKYYKEAYNIDFNNNARRFPLLVNYAMVCDTMLLEFGNVLELVYDLPSSILGLQPDYLHPPYLHVPRENHFLIFDPSQGKLINILIILEGDNIKYEVSPELNIWFQRIKLLYQAAYIKTAPVLEKIQSKIGSVTKKIINIRSDISNILAFIKDSPKYTIMFGDTLKMLEQKINDVRNYRLGVYSNANNFAITVVKNVKRSWFKLAHTLVFYSFDFNQNMTNPVNSRYFACEVNKVIYAAIQKEGVAFYEFIVNSDVNAKDLVIRFLARRSLITNDDMILALFIIWMMNRVPSSSGEFFYDEVIFKDIYTSMRDRYKKFNSNSHKILKYKISSIKK